MDQEIVGIVADYGLVGIILAAVGVATRTLWAFLRGEVWSAYLKEREAARIHQERAAEALALLLQEVRECMEKIEKQP